MSHLRKMVLGRNIKRFGSRSSQLNYSPTNWSQYFDKQDNVDINGGTFNYYKKGNSGPIIVCLHGGGYSGLTWALFAVEITALIDCQVYAVDLRGHGNTKTDNDSDLSLDTLAKDVRLIVEQLFGDCCPVIIVGHSMGGAVAVEASYLVKSPVCLCVIDIVEGTALEALSSMQSILRGRPANFKSIQHGIQWCYKSGQTLNIEAAKVSMPGQIINIKTENLAANEINTAEAENSSGVISEFRKPLPPTLPSSTIVEENENDKQCYNDCDKPPLPKTARTVIAQTTVNDEAKYKWRIDLSKTEHFWPGWFKGLSSKFLAIHIPKLLMLANIHGLDTTLTVGQMQGKFHLQVLSRSGHAIHEDQPHNVAEILGGYLVKQKLAISRSPLTYPMPEC